MGRYGRGCGSLLRPGGRRGLLGGAGVLPRRTSVLGARISQSSLARKGETGSKRRGHWTKVILRSRRFPNPTQGSLPRCTRFTLSSPRATTGPCSAVAFSALAVSAGRRLRRPLPSARGPALGDSPLAGPPSSSQRIGFLTLSAPRISGFPLCLRFPGKDAPWATPIG